jgi:hypothetical protein
MTEYYHYTAERLLPSILKDGMWPNHPLYTTNVYYSALAAGQAVGVMAHNIDCVLKFIEDGGFKSFSQPIVPSTGRFIGGATQYSHPGRPKPVAKRKINERIWTRI